MASLYKVIVFAAAILSAACTEKAADSNPAKTAAPPVTAMTEEKVAKLQREAQAGDPDAQYDLAYMYENGVGVPKNETKALELYQQAADQGHSAAQNNLDAMSSAK